MIHEVLPDAAFEAFKKDKNAKLIDVRTPGEFTKVHASGAIHIVLANISKAALAAL